jgi:hypothetical protein
MAYTVKTAKVKHTLHGKMVTLRGGRKKPITLLAKKKMMLCDALPDGYKTTENKRTGLPMPRKLIALN